MTGFIKVKFTFKNIHKILLGAGIALVIAMVYLLFMQVRKWIKMRSALSDIRKMAIEMGAEDVAIDTTSNSISFVMFHFVLLSVS